MKRIDLALAIAFAKLELIEVQAGQRRLTECPGLEQVFLAMGDAKYETMLGASAPTNQRPNEDQS